MIYFSQDISGCFNSQEGLEDTFFKPLRGQLDTTQKQLKKSYEEGALPLFHLPYLRKDLQEVEALVLRIQDDFSDVVILGTGGSSLGAQAFYKLKKNSSPQLHFMDNIDPYTFEVLFKKLDPHATAFLVISKSGKTMETLLQFLVAAEYWVGKVGVNTLKNHFVVITEDTDSPLRKLADEFHIPFIAHDPNIGGRFSALSLVGLLPAMIAGLNPVSIREGAAHVFNRILNEETCDKIEPAIGAAVNFSLSKKKRKNLSVLMPYVDRLEGFSLWYRQLWAESLGKDGKGTTPIQAMGTVDQHSQLQLYLEGPKDKFFTILTSNFQKEEFKVDPSFIKDPQLEFLAGVTMGDLMEAEQKATIKTLLRNNCPTRLIHVPEIKEEAMGALMMHFILETLFMADLYKINPFDQPAVEDGKILAKKYLRSI